MGFEGTVPVSVWLETQPRCHSGVGVQQCRGEEGCRSLPVFYLHQACCVSARQSPPVFSGVVTSTEA